MVDVDALNAEERAALGETVREIRTARGLTQSEVAEAAGISLKTYGTLERGVRAAHAGNLRKVLEVLGVPQVSDLDRYDEDTRAFIASTAPIFQNLPQHARATAQTDVVLMLGSRLAQASRLTALNVPGLQDDVALAAYDDHDWQARQEQENE
ncbi:helix-turn-helix domain-containing protein [Microbacterium sp. YY-01]|uniref:helix-turn-helix domain-containing protein n=1 Tax=Microbacterium sp. YY-01 TaxID=3421634 RepID=UPI003D169B00